MPWQHIGDILFIKRMVGMNNRGTGLLGDIRSKMVAEILALAMDDNRIPVN